MRFSIGLYGVSGKGRPRGKVWLITLMLFAFTGCGRVEFGLLDNNLENDSGFDIVASSGPDSNGFDSTGADSNNPYSNSADSNSPDAYVSDLDGSDAYVPDSIGPEDPSCSDSIMNGFETDVDCGGSICEPCGEQLHCSTSSDCTSNVCESSRCKEALCDDGIQNQDETAVDCGGDTCPACPTCDDEIQNQDETDVDCGGDICPACPSCDDGIENQDETAVDCGGDTCPACPTCDDGIQNQDETAVDCGGDTCPACPSCTFGPFSAPELITGFGLSGELYGPSLSADAGTLYFTEVPSSASKHIMTATRGDRGAVFSAAVEVQNINDGNDIGTPFISADDLTIYFFSSRSGGQGAYDILSATRPNTSSSFDNVDWLSEINSSEAEYCPNLSSDELTIIFVSTRGGGAGSSDLWTAQRSNRSDGFSTPTNLSSINTASRETGPSLSSDGLTLYFVSDRSGGSGNTDIWFATRTDVASDFSNPQNLTVVNSSANDLDAALSSDGRELFFSSGRSGNTELYRSIRDCI